MRAELMNLIWGLVTLFSCLGFSANISYESYMKKAYKECSVKSNNIFLTSRQLEMIKKKIAKSKVSSLVNYFDVSCKNKKFKVFLDTHRVRTLNETILVEIQADKITDIVITNFMEPLEYKLPLSWIKQLKGKTSSSKLKISDDVDGLTGATLSSHALVKAAKKILVYNRVALEK